MPILLGIYEKAIPLQLSWNDKFSLAKEAGFDFIEVSIDGLEPRINRLNWTQEQIQELRMLAEQFEMPFQTMAFTANRYYPLGDCDPIIRNKGLEYAKKAIELASQLKIQVVQLASYDVRGHESTKQSQKNFYDSLMILAQEAKRFNLVIATEVLEDVPFFSTIKQGAKIIKRLNHPNLKLYGDLGNVASLGLDSAHDLKYHQNQLIACHIKDAVLGNDRNIPYGTGLVDFDACMKQFVTMNYTGYFVAEAWSEEKYTDGSNLKIIHDFIRGWMKRFNL